MDYKTDEGLESWQFLAALANLTAESLQGLGKEADSGPHGHHETESGGVTGRRSGRTGSID